MSLTNPLSDNDNTCTAKILFKQIQISNMPSYMAYTLEDYSDLVIIRDALINAKVSARSNPVYRNAYVFDVFEKHNCITSYIPLCELVTDYLNNTINSINLKLLYRVAHILLIKLTDIK